jgi:hypothetical protein
MSKFENSQSRSTVFLFDPKYAHQWALVIEKGSSPFKKVAKI